jgi:hypothetical protein
VLKKVGWKVFFLYFSSAAVGRFLRASGSTKWSRAGWGVGWAEEPHESLDVLGRRCQEELLPHKLQSPQAQAAQPDLILEFREQGVHLLSLSLCMGELWRVRQLPCALPGRFIHVDGKKTKRSAGALGF